mgnify:CR=1 FL=1
MDFLIGIMLVIICILLLFNFEHKFFVFLVKHLHQHMMLNHQLLLGLQLLSILRNLFVLVLHPLEILLIFYYQTFTLINASNTNMPILYHNGAYKFYKEKGFIN